MKLVMTTVVRDEDDILKANLDYHLARGVDFIIATNHDSQDGTGEILRRYVAKGKLHLLEERGQEGKWFPQGAFFTRMARLAATDFAADWVINCDADEFWWPAEGSLKDMFDRISPRYGTVSAPIFEYFPRVRGPMSVAHRMTIREVRSFATFKMAHRAIADVSVGTGSHHVAGPGMVSAPVWPARILHFPVRSIGQLEKRARLRARSGKSVYREQYEAYREGRLKDYFDEHSLDDAQARAGISAGYLVEDPRLAAFFDGEPPAIDVEEELADIREDMLHAIAREQSHWAAVRERRINRAHDRIAKLDSRVATLAERVDGIDAVASLGRTVRRIRRTVRRSVGDGARNGQR